MQLSIQQNMKNHIYEIRGKQVIPDFILAELYEVETKRINEAVKNNSYKFPERFSWKLTDDESKIFLVENFDQKMETRGGKYKNPRVFTEQGVAMLATILKSKKAIATSISIMDAFVAMRHYIQDNQDVFISLNKINHKIEEHEEKLKLLFSGFDSKEKLFLPNQEYDSYSYVYNICRKAKQELIIIDAYADITLLDMLRNINCKIIIIISTKAKLSEKEVEKFQLQYSKITVITNNSFHDRYLILDQKTIYHIGTSINYLGKKVFSVHLLEDSFVKDNLLNYVKNIMSINKKISE